MRGILFAIVLLSARAQDTRTVTEPVIPPVCATLSARLSAPIAAADENKLDTARIQDAIDKCQSGHAVKLTSDGASTSFLSGPLNLRAGVTLLVDRGANFFASRDPRVYDISPGTCGLVNENGRGCKPLISADHVSDAGVMGEGVIDGRGGAPLLGQEVSWWDLAQEAKVKNLYQNCPRIMILSHADNFTLYRITLKNSPNFHVMYSGGNGFTAWGVIIDSPKTSRNTDGIDPSSATNVTITHCYIHAGDDNVAIKAGAYTIPFLLPGIYDIQVQSPGFKEAVRNGLQLSSGDHPVIDIRLDVGEASQSVSVTADAPLVNSENASVGQAITTKQVEDLPLNGRTPLMLAQLAIGVAATGNPSLVHPFDNAGAAAWSIGGAPKQPARS